MQAVASPLFALAPPSVGAHQLRFHARLLGHAKTTPAWLHHGDESQAAAHSWPGAVVIQVEQPKCRFPRARSMGRGTSQLPDRSLELVVVQLDGLRVQAWRVNDGAPLPRIQVHHP